MSKPPFWESLTLEEMDQQQWESLCDGCGRCCAVKLQDNETGTVHYTSAACRLLDTETCRCTDYTNRKRRVADCLVLDPQAALEFDWLPHTCAYRRIAEGRGLAWWHPLVSGDAETVHAAGISVRGQLISEQYVHIEEIPMLVRTWKESSRDD